MGGASALSGSGCARSDDGILGHNLDDPLNQSATSPADQFRPASVNFCLGSRAWSASSLDTASEKVLLRLLPSLRWEIRHGAPVSPQGSILISTRGAVAEFESCKAERGAKEMGETKVPGGDVSWRRRSTGEGETYVRLNGGATLLERSRAVSIAFESALGLSGLFSIHAGGVVSPDGAGALFVGPGGAGKTTLTLMLVSHGWSYLSDDQVALDLTTNGVQAYGLRRQLGVVGSDIDTLCGPVAPEAMGPHPGHPHKRRVNGDMVFPGRFQPSVRPGVLFFPVRGAAGASRLLRLSPSRALDRLIRFSPWGGRDASSGRDQLEVLKRLSLQSPAYELLTDSTLPRDSGLVELLAETIGDAP